MAGINSMARQPEGGSRGPMEEVTVELQPALGTLLGVELGCENIIARNGRREDAAVIGFAHAVLRILRMGIVAVHEIEVAGVRNAGPQPMRARLAHLVP